MKNINRKKGVLLIVLIGVLLIIASLSVYTLLFDNEGTSTPSNTVDNNTSSSVVDVFKSKNGVFTLKIIDKSDKQVLADVEKKDDEILNPVNVEYYAYFNDTLLGVINIDNADEHYRVYEFSGYPNTEATGYTLIVNLDTKTIEINPEELEGKSATCMEEDYCGFTHAMSYIKTDLGYFFIDLSNGTNTLYTTSWKELGFVYIENNKLKEIDSKGVTTYSDRTIDECPDYNCEWVLSNPTKYDVNGKEVTN